MHLAGRLERLLRLIRLISVPHTVQPRRHSEAVRVVLLRYMAVQSWFVSLGWATARARINFQSWILLEMVQGHTMGGSVRLSLFAFPDTCQLALVAVR